MRPKSLMSNLEIVYALSTDTKIDYLGWLWTATRSNSLGISQIWEATTAKWMNVNQYCQRQRCDPLNLLRKVMFPALICGSFPGASYTHCCHALTLALARLSCFVSVVLPDVAKFQHDHPSPGPLNNDWFMKNSWILTSTSYFPDSLCWEITQVAVKYGKQVLHYTGWAKN